MKYHLIPCDLRKRPLTKNGEKNASADPKQATEWQRLHPGCNWAIATGPSGLIAVDEDTYKEAYVAGQLEEACGLGKLQTFPHTVEWKTARGGRVRIYKRPEGIEVPSRIGAVPAVDVKASSGYVLVPPSKNSEGQVYEWVNHPRTTPVADAPAALVMFLLQKAGAAERATLSDRAPAEGELYLRAGDGRWEAMRRYAGALRRWGWGERAIFGALQAFVEAHCEPDDTVRDEEVERVARFVASLPPGEAPRVKRCKDCRHVVEAQKLQEIEQLEEDSRRGLVENTEGKWRAKG